MAISLVSTITVGSGGASSLEWTNIAQNGKDLLIVVSARTTQTGITDNLLLRLNGSSTSFSGRYLFTNIDVLISGTDTRQAGAYAGSSASSNTFSNVQLYFADYASSGAKLWAVDSTSENNNTNAGLYIDAKLWNETNAITSILLEPTGGTYVQHTTASLYIIS